MTIQELRDIARLAARARWARTVEELEALREQATKIISKANDASCFQNRAFGEITTALSRKPWIHRLSAALVEVHQQEPLDEFNSALVRLQNCSEILHDAISESRARLKEPLICDQLRVGRWLNRKISARFLSNFQGIEGRLTPTLCQRIFLASCLAFNQPRNIATAEPFGRLLELLDAAGVPSADRVVSLEAPESPLISSD